MNVQQWFLAGILVSRQAGGGETGEKTEGVRKTEISDRDQKPKAQEKKIG